MLCEKITIACLSDPYGPIDSTWDAAASTILKCARDTLGETKGGKRGDRAAWFWDEDLQRVVKAKKDACRAWQKTMSHEALAEYKQKKKEAKREVARAKSAAMDKLYEKLDSSQAEKHVFRLARARHKASLDLSEASALKDEEEKVLRDQLAVKQRS
ncbi:hypothetical protein Y032_0178g688 [Ancylostoma ceylanicum]|uniref:Uncharacterized protein n=1 Tax=Ancylostoma ceylanicum TaxID=53326 RepID=A0A016SU15_9BILA|nr:hypothetical protein Y032_0178g688 [Ancylostoma ceylanicum]